MTAPAMTHTWRIRRYLGERHGQRCRIWAVATGPGPKSIGVEFEDGVRVITSRFSVRRIVGAQ